MAMDGHHPAHAPAAPHQAIAPALEQAPAHMPPAGREAFRSAEWVVIQESIQNSVQAAVAESNRALREDLKEFRSDIKGDFNGLKIEVGRMQVQLSQGDGMFKLQEQRVKWLEEAHRAAEEEERERERAGLLGDTTRLQRAISDAEARKRADKTSDDSGKRRSDDKDRPLISPKVFNAFFLAFAAAAGATVWALIEHAFTASPPAPPQVAPSVAPTSPTPTHSPLPGAATGG